MTIRINDEQTAVPEGTTINDLVYIILQLQPAGMAVAVNESIVPRHSWEASQLQAGDKVLIIKASQGG
ncbi:MAG TPA: sulfur carrier protein ThiS [Paludibacter sp.]|nr:sulfur carrier protein ThiS [Paludibacter sp.]